MVRLFDVNARCLAENHELRTAKQQFLSARIVAWRTLSSGSLGVRHRALWGLTDMGYDTIQIHLDALLKEQLSTYSHTNMVDESAVVSAALRQYLESDQPTSSELAAGYKEMATINRAIAADFAATEDHDERRIV